MNIKHTTEGERAMAITTPGVANPIRVHWAAPVCEHPRIEDGTFRITATPANGGEPVVVEAPARKCATCPEWFEMPDRISVQLGSPGEGSTAQRGEGGVSGLGSDDPRRIIHATDATGAANNPAAPEVDTGTGEGAPDPLQALTLRAHPMSHPTTPEDK